MIRRASAETVGFTVSRNHQTQSVAYSPVAECCPIGARHREANVRAIKPPLRSPPDGLPAVLGRPPFGTPKRCCHCDLLWVAALSDRRPCHTAPSCQRHASPGRACLMTAGNPRRGKAWVLSLKRAATTPK